MSAGRHRIFDIDIALDKAMKIFWTNGYTGTSLADLTNGMGINKPSLYSAFGNKEGLFKRALTLYFQKYGAIHVEKLSVPGQSLKERIRCYLVSIAEMVANSDLPGGCLVTISTCEAGGTCLPSGVLCAVANINDTTKSTLKKFFIAEKAQGNLQINDSPDIVANFLLTIQFGLAVMARTGSTRKELNQIIDHALSDF